MIVRCEDIKKSFGSFTAVDGVSFSLARGECVGLLGPNGAGKSTIISMLYGATSRSGGEMTVFNLDPMRDARAIKKRLGVVTQDNYLDESMSVLENMLLFASFKGLSPADARTAVGALLEFMALDHKADEKIRALSGGMQRRLAFVRALLGKPDLVILDEPTTGLDPAVRHLLWDKIRELKANGATILLTTHYMDEAEQLCDRVVIMDKGKVKDVAHPRSLIQKYCPGFLAGFAPNEALEAAISKITDANSRFKLFKDSATISLRAPSFKELEEILSELGHEPTVIRPSNLEDVFLEVTGRELSANA